MNSKLITMNYLAPTEPTEPAEPAEPPEPTEPTEPADSPDSSDSTDSTDSTDSMFSHKVAPIGVAKPRKRGVFNFQTVQKPASMQFSIKFSINLQLGEIQKHKSCEARCAVPKGFELDPILSAAPIQPQGKLIPPIPRFKFPAQAGKIVH